MKKPLYFWLMSVFSLVLGFAGGAEYVMRRVDAMDAVRVAHQAEIDAKRLARDQEFAADANKVDEMRDEAITRLRSESEVFAQANAACRQQFAEGTLLYETPAVAQVSLGLRSILGMGVSQTPGANVAPRWWIPAHIKPQVYGASQGAVYYYISTDNRVDGPYLPDAAGVGP
jgi:hypothetical protein